MCIFSWIYLIVSLSWCHPSLHRCLVVFMKHHPKGKVIETTAKSDVRCTKSYLMWLEVIWPFELYYEISTKHSVVCKYGIVLWQIFCPAAVGILLIGSVAQYIHVKVTGWRTELYLRALFLMGFSHYLVRTMELFNVSLLSENCPCLAETAVYSYWSGS